MKAAVKIDWVKGDRVKITTTTAGPEVLEIVAFRRRKNGEQYVVLADHETAIRIKSGEVDAKIVVLTGIGGRVREVETQWLHTLARKGMAVPA